MQVKLVPNFQKKEMKAKQIIVVQVFIKMVPLFLGSLQFCWFRHKCIRNLEHMHTRRDREHVFCRCA